MEKQNKTKQTPAAQNDRKAQDWIRFAISVAIVLVVVYLGSFAFAKLDLTQEKRYSLTDSTIELLESVEDPILIRCYLHGDLPARFLRLEKAMAELLDQFNDYSDGQIDFEFVDPYQEENDQETVEKLQQELLKFGLEPSRLEEYSKGAFENLLIWPGLVLSRSEETIPLNFLKSEMAANSDEMVNNSLNNLEYELGSALKRLVEPRSQKLVL